MANITFAGWNVLYYIPSPQLKMLTWFELNSVNFHLLSQIFCLFDRIMPTLLLILNFKEMWTLCVCVCVYRHIWLVSSLFCFLVDFVFSFARTDDLWKIWDCSSPSVLISVIYIDSDELASGVFSCSYSPYSKHVGKAASNFIITLQSEVLRWSLRTHGEVERWKKL